MTGEQLTVEQAIANLEGQDLGMRLYSAWWLGRFRVKEERAIQALVKALQDRDDRTPNGGYPLRRNAARALGKLGDRNVVPHLMDCLSCEDFYVREAAAQSLEMLQDPVCIPHLIKLLAEPESIPHPAPELPYLAQPFDAIIEALGTLGAIEAVGLIAPYLEHEVPRIRFAAARALYQLTDDRSRYGQILIDGLNSPDLQLRRAVLADIGAIGYLQAAQPVADTLAENSLKLLALKGILEQNLPPDYLTAETIAVMDLMDSLL
ncbi:MAG: HEAT repeat domain-containing protein [Pseudanabaenaceae cyanobacterium SKYGB_i_bin29]|nr:HEAT repeat domain-containing protein [Pseudanabaenaceae cyanobacterium SKYG29]MDW8421328.1 HEAT repeat domain-containing protein [Pseudanabaenaceae cyanobacterium SKYGB_i_bin29]